MVFFGAAYQPYNEYSSGGGGGGGGFETTDQRPNSSESSGAQGRFTTLTPVTIKQVLQSQQQVQDGPFVINNQELFHVCFVGVIRNIVDETSNVKLTIEDGTGQIDVKKWSADPNDVAASQDENLKKNYNSQVAQQYHIGTYVKVFGALKEFGGKQHVQYALIKNIESFNEVITHHLEVIKWYTIASGKFTPSKANAEEQNSSAPSLFVKDSDSHDTGNSLQRVLGFCREQCVDKDPNNFAVQVQLIAQSLNLDETTVRDCCTTLTEQGFIYPTINDSNFFALNS